MGQGQDSRTVAGVGAQRWRQIAEIVGLLYLLGMPATSQAPNPPRNVPEFLNRLPDQNDVSRMRQQQTRELDFAAANALRQKQVAEDSAKLLRLATELKAELDKGGKDTRSASALRKADAIEKLARNIKQKMTVTVIGK
jgi:hypothetical protein